MVNSTIEALDGQRYCAALFIDLSKAFDTVDHVISADRLHKISFSNQAVNWFSNYLSDRTEFVQVPGSFFLPVLKSVPQGSIRGPLLLTIHVNSLRDNLSDAMSHFYADHTVAFVHLLQL